MTAGAATLARIEQLIAANRLVGEDGRAHAVRDLQAADKELAQWVVDAQHGPRARILQAEISMALRRWQIAAERWRLVSEKVPDQRDYALCRAAFAHRKSGNLFAAQRALDEVDAGFRDQKRYLNETRRVKGATDGWVATQLSGHALQWLLAGEGRKAARAMSTAAALRDYSAPDLGALDRVTDTLATWLETGRVEAPATAAAPQRLVALAGFGWSGSGAVADYLRDFPGVIFPAANTELTFFEGRSGAAHSLVSLLEETGSEEEGWRRAVGTFLGWTVLGLAFPPGRQSEAIRWHRKSLGSFLTGHMERMVVPVAAFLSTVGAPGREPRSVAQAAQRLFAAVMGASEPDAVLALNNSIHARHFGLLAGFEGALGVAVVRDPRDQFVARLLENDRNTTSCRQFIRGLQADRERFERALRDERVAARVTTVRFEQFVTDPAERTRVAAFVGVSGSDGEQAFDATKSARNVGIHKTHGNQADIRKIEAAFPDLLWA